MEVINTACHASNCLYLHRLSKKTPYELLIGRKPNVSYFRVFGCKCYIFKKRQRLGKFERRCGIGLLVGYASNSKAYRVFNNATGMVEESCDVEFDESNGSQGERLVCDDVCGEPLREAMKNMACGDVKPKEDEDEPQPSTSTTSPPLTSQVDQEEEEEKDDQPFPSNDVHISQDQAHAQA